jgi:glucosamine 6-phosphate synthetase-like amidotransferase/phosphosugar isomerase protein
LISASHAPHGPPFEKIFSNICELTARNGRVVLVTDAESAAEAEEAAFRMRVVPRTDPFVLALSRRRHQGDKVDQSRNLAKSVTVEGDKRYGRFRPHRKETVGGHSGFEPQYEGSWALWLI